MVHCMPGWVEVSKGNYLLGLRRKQPQQKKPARPFEFKQRWWSEDRFPTSPSVHQLETAKALKSNGTTADKKEIGRREVVRCFCSNRFSLVAEL